jgi:hypothetical protein
MLRTRPGHKATSAQIHSNPPPRRGIFEFRLPRIGTREPFHRHRSREALTPSKRAFFQESEPYPTILYDPQIYYIYNIALDIQGAIGISLLERAVEKRPVKTRSVGFSLPQSTGTEAEFPACPPSWRERADYVPKFKKGVPKLSIFSAPS